jgi:hypothetical protein
MFRIVVNISTEVLPRVLLLGLTLDGGESALAYILIQRVISLVLVLSVSLCPICGMDFFGKEIYTKSSSVSTFPSIKGMTLIAWGAEDYGSPNFDQSISNLAGIRANWVTFTVFWFMENYYDTEMHRRSDLYTVSDLSLIHAIQKAHELDMKVAIKPMVDVVDGTWRGDISPVNWTLWFQNYRSFINYYAALAEANDAELFTVGTELRSSQVYTTEWINVIDDVRVLFSNDLTYAANWDSYDTSNVAFWSILDYVGVDAYFPLTNSNNPTVSQLINAWSHCTASGWWGTGRNWTNELFLTYNQTGKKIVFTEIGYYSQDGTNKQPWTGFSPPHSIDLQEQADCYQAALEVFKNETWFMGWFWWNWETDPDAGGPYDNWYLLQNKPAQAILNQYYLESPPDIAVTYLTCSDNFLVQGDSATIDVTTQNQGVYSEIFNLTIYANTTIIKTETISLENGTSSTTTFFWNTTSFHKGEYTISAYAWPLQFETDTSDNTYTDGTVIIESHDIAITNVTCVKTSVGQGYVSSINVTMVNIGDFSEILEIRVYADLIMVAQSSDIDLASGQSAVLTMTWNTESFAKGNYSISAVVDPVPDERDVADNSFVDGNMLITIPGDINADQYVNAKDAVVLGAAFYPDGAYTPNADINDDFYVNAKDAVVLGNHFDQNWS